MITEQDILDFINKMGLLTENKTHDITEILIQPFINNLSYITIINDQGDTKHFHYPIYKESER